MPRIEPYNPPIPSLQPTERGVDARTQAARRIGTFYNQAAGAISGAAEANANAAGDVARSATGVASAVETAAVQAEDYAGLKEESARAAAGTKKIDDLTTVWNGMVQEAAKRDPNDPTVAANFRENVLEPELQKFSEAYSSTDRGRRSTEQYIESVRNHFYVKTAADMSALAGEAVSVNAKRVVSESTNTAFKSPDSHTVDFLLDHVSNEISSVVGAAPNLKGADAARVQTKLTESAREQIVKAAAQGAIAKAPDPEKVAQDFADKYPQYISGADAKQLAQAATYYTRLNRSAARADRVQADYEAKTDFNRRVTQLEADTMPQNAGDPPQMPKDAWQRMRDLAHHPGAALEPGRIVSMTKNLESIQDRLNKPEPLGPLSHDTTMGIISDIRSGKITDTGPIYDLYGQGKLNRADFNFAVNEVRNMKTPEGAALGDDRKEFFKRYGPSVDGGMALGSPSALGAQKLYQFEMEARRQEQDLRKKNIDPHTLYDPASPNFLGKQVSKYHISMQEGMEYEKAIQGEKSAQQAGPATGTPPPKAFVAPSNWDWNGARRQYRDPQGNFYDANGKRVKAP